MRGVAPHLYIERLEPSVLKRLGLSLERAYTLIHKTRRDLFLISLAAILCGISLAVYMAMRIARPIGQLVAGVHEFAKGSYDHPIRVDSREGEGAVFYFTLPAADGAESPA